MIIVFSFVSTFAVNIDGKDDGVEWQHISTKIMINKKHSNNVDYATMKYQVVDEYEVCFLLYLSDRTSENCEKSGFILNIFEDLTVTVSSNGTQLKGKTDNYFVDSKMVYIEDNAVSCEILVGCKRGLSDEIKGTVSFIDGEGISSYFCPFNVELPTEAATTNKTTKAETTRTERTTRAKTTDSKTTTEKPVKTTVERTTKKPSETRKPDKTYIYYYEKEVIVSQVIVSDAVQTIVISEVATDSQTETVTQRANLTTGFVVQRVVVGLGILLLIVGGAIAGMTFKKTKSVEEKTEDTEPKDQ